MNRLLFEQKSRIRQPPDAIEREQFNSLLSNGRIRGSRLNYLQTKEMIRTAQATDQLTEGRTILHTRTHLKHVQLKTFRNYNHRQ